MIQVLLPIRTRSEANLREHWAKRARRVRSQRQIARSLVRTVWPGGGVREPHTIKLTRIGPGRLDSDNLAGSLKAVRDGIADAMGIDDGSPLLDWNYDQHTGRRGEYAVLVEIKRMKDVC